MNRFLPCLVVIALLPACDGCDQDLSAVTAQGQLDPAVFNFGVVRAGATCEGRIKLRDVGQQDMTVGGAIIRDDNSGGAYSVLSIPTSVVSNGDDEVVVQYAPTAASNGLQTATLVVNTNDPDDRGEVKGILSGEATTEAAGKILPRCKTRVDDTDETEPCTLVEFGSTPKLEVGAPGGLTRQITVINDGTADFQILGVNILSEGTGQAPEFTLELVNDQPPAFPVTVVPSRSGDCGEPVANAAPARLGFIFKPTRVGIQTARVEIITTATTAGSPSDAPAGQARVTLTGIGSGVGLSLEPAFLTFGSVAVGTEERKQVRVANLDINPASVNTSCIDLNGNGTCYADPQCTSGCASDPEDIDCTGGTADATTGLNCDIEGKGKGFVLEATDAQEGGNDEVRAIVMWTPPSAVSFSKDMLFMTNIAGNRTYSVRITGGTAGHIVVDPGSIFVPASADTVGATGAATFTVSNDGEADLVISRIEFVGSPSITDDFRLTRTGDSAIDMGCTRGPTDPSCNVVAWTGTLTLAPDASTTFNIAYADNDPAVAQDVFSIALTHNGTGGSPFSVDVEVCKPSGGSSNRPTCP